MQKLIRIARRNSHLSRRDLVDLLMEHGADRLTAERIAG